MFVFPKAPSPHDIDEKPEGSCGDGRIGKVKCRPVIAFYKEIQEINHITKPYPVYKITQGPSEDKGKPYSQPPSIVFRPVKEAQDYPYSHYCYGKQEVIGETESALAKDAEGHTPVLNQNEIERPRDYGKDLMQL